MSVLSKLFGHPCNIVSDEGAAFDNRSYTFQMNFFGDESHLLYSHFCPHHHRNRDHHRT